MRRVLLVTALLLATGAHADTTSLGLLARAWPEAKPARVGEIGRGIGVVFSPDLSVKDNCRFYQALGFACFEDADWERILGDIHRFNVLYPESRISTLVLETHGTNGNGLKLQQSYDPDAERSYIAVGALQERLERDGIDHVIISACNSGRLLRPQIYSRLDPNNGDKLFLDPTCGILNASDTFDPKRSPVVVLTPKSSHIETTLVGSVSELRPSARKALLAAAKAKGIKPPKQFAVSDMMVQMLVRDPKLSLAANSYVEEFSKTVTPTDRSEELFTKFLTYVNAVAEKETMRPATRAAAK